jgi:hypothetical protein
MPIPSGGQPAHPEKEQLDVLKNGKKGTAMASFEENAS